MSAAEAALSSKWEGVQSVALQVLGGWGGKNAIDIIRGFLDDAFAREHGWAIRNVAVKELAKLVGSDDVDWVLNLYFWRPGVLEKHELLPVVLSLPPAKAKAGLVRELASSDPTIRQAAVKAIGNMPFKDRKALLTPLHKDENTEVRASARALTP
jgi:HEAT repeat protein